MTDHSEAPVDRLPWAAEYAVLFLCGPAALARSGNPYGLDIARILVALAGGVFWVAIAWFVSRGLV